MMRVITGSARGRRLETLPGEDVTRPTTESVKEALFSMIQFDIEGRRVLDLFAGSGQLGIEALSRGARSCTFVENNRPDGSLYRRSGRAVSGKRQSASLRRARTRRIGRQRAFERRFRSRRLGARA